MTRTPMPRDPNERAKAVVDLATGQRSPGSGRPRVKGGKTRAANMIAEQRSESAGKAAVARWQKERSA